MVKEVSLLYAPFKYFVSGHVCLVFKLQDGREVVISPEAWTDRFIPLLGFAPFYRLRYSQLEYHEYIKKYQKTSRHFHAIKLDLRPNSAHELYIQMSAKVADLENRKENYHILFNSCITNTYSHLKKMENRSFGIIEFLLLPFRPQLLAVLVKEPTLRE